MTNSNSILLQNLSPEQLEQLISNGIKSQLDDFKKNFTPKQEDELLTRTEACELLKINSSTLFHWTNKGKVTCFAIAGRRYYKKSDLLASLTQVKI